MSITREQLASDLARLGVESGETLLFHSSLKAIGYVKNGPGEVIDAFRNVLGAEGTLAVPTIVPALRGIRPLFSVTESPSEMGILTETVRLMPEAVRSNHPTHSIAAIGKRAQELCRDHRAGSGPPTPWGANALGYHTPWDRLREWNAWILLVGVGFGNCTLLHHVQVRYLDALRGATWRDEWPAFDFAKMGDRLDQRGIVTHGTIGEAPALLARAGEIVRVALEELGSQEHPFSLRREAQRWADARARVLARGRTMAATFCIPVTPTDLDREVGRTLHMRGVILENPESGRHAHVVWDHGAMLHEDADPIRKVVAAAAKVPFDRVLLTATHTHSGYWWPFVPHPEFRDFVMNRIRTPIEEAALRLEPVRAGWRTIPALGLRRSRTVYLRDGRAYTERWAIPSSWHIPDETVLRHGPDDDELRVLVLERLDHSRLAVMANFSCHNSAAMNDPRVNDDFFGVAAELVGNVEGCPVLISPGSEGDQDPTAMIELGGTRDMAYAERMGKRLAGHLLNALAEVTMHDSFDVTSAGELVTVTIKEGWRDLMRESDNEFHRTRAREGKVELAVGSLVVGDYAMVGIPAEFFTTPAMSIRTHSPFPITSVMALTNGDVIYVAEEEAFFEGSQIYGTELHMPEMAVPGTDRVFVDAALRALRSVVKTRGIG